MKILRLPQVKEMLGGISTATLYRWMDKGAFPRPFKIVGRSNGWLEEDIVKWIEGRMQNGKDGPKT